MGFDSKLKTVHSFKVKSAKVDEVIRKAKEIAKKDAKKAEQILDQLIAKIEKVVAEQRKKAKDAGKKVSTTSVKSAKKQVSKVKTAKASTKKNRVSLDELITKLQKKHSISKADAKKVIKTQLDKDMNALDKLIAKLSIVDKRYQGGAKLSKEDIDYIPPKAKTKTPRKRDLRKDKSVGAKKSGKRLSPTYGKPNGAKRKYYWENRMNRADVDGRIRLGEGGTLFGEGGSTYQGGGEIPKGFTKELETEDFIYYTDKDGEQVIMTRKSDGSIASDNYFAENDLFERMVEIANGREKYIYLRPSSKEYLKEYKDEYAKGGSTYAGGGEIITDGGNYLEIHADSDTMKITLLDDGKEEVISLREDGMSDIDIMDFLFEDIVVNSGLVWHRDLGESGLGMTSASGVTDGYYYEDDGSFTSDYRIGDEHPSRIYYFNDYALRSEVDDLMNKGLILNSADSYQGGGEVEKKDIDDGLMAKGGNVGSENKIMREYFGDGMDNLREFGTKLYDMKHKSEKEFRKHFNALDKMFTTRELFKLK